MATRRDTLKLIGVAALAPAVAPGASPQKPDDANAWTKSPEGLLRALMKLRASLDHRLTLEWFQGIAYGVVDSGMLPLFTVNAVAFAHYSPAADGSFRGRRAEITFHTALDDARPLQRFENPYTGELVDVPSLRTPNEDAVIDTRGLVAPERAGPLRIESEPSLGPGTVNGDRCWVRLDTRTRIFRDDNATPITTYGESITYAGRTADVVDPAVLCAPCQLSYTNVMNWRPWMRMGDRPGHTTTIASGEKVQSLDEVPEILRRYVEERHPDLAENTRAALAVKELLH